jgi:hypothetical protein
MKNTISSIASSMAALILKQSYERGNTIQIPSLGITFRRPEPGFESVIPAGEGWYSFTDGKWRYDVQLDTGLNRYLTNVDLLQFAVDAAKALNE